MKAGEIFVDLRLKKDKFDKGIADSKKSLKLFALEAVASVYLLDRFAEKSTNAATKLVNLSRASGIAAKNLKQYGIAATLMNAGISAEDASTQIAKFAENLYSIQRFGQGDFGGFNKLQAIGKGIAYYGKEADQVLGDIHDKIQGLSDMEAVNVLGAFGFSPEMLPLFRASREEIEKIAATKMMDDAEIARLEKADRIINDIKVSWGALQNRIVLEASPALEWLAKSMSNAAQNITSSGGIFSAIKNKAKSDFGWLKNSAAEDKYWLDMHMQLRAMGKSPEEIENIIAGMRSQGATTDSTSGSAPGANNWGNIRGADGKFRAFATPQEGMDALVGDVRAKISGRSTAMRGKYGANYVPTLNSLISTYAPPSENNTRGYVDFMQKQTGIGANTPLTAGDIESVVKGIAKMEGNKNITVNNTNHIHGDDAAATAGMIGDELSKTLKHALADQNNGAF